MFSIEQVRKWTLLTDEEQGSGRYQHHYFGSTDLHFSARPAMPARAMIGRQTAPAKIFGTPIDASCLNGVVDSDLWSEPVTWEVLRNARVVGNAAVLSKDGRLFASEDVALRGKDVFLRQNAFGHQGFLLKDRGDRVTLSFAQQRSPGFQDLDALFIHNIEPSNYGSFMFRQLPQILYAREFAKNFDCYITSDRTTFLMEALRLFGLPSKPVYTTHEISGEVFKSISFSHGHDAEGYLADDVRKKLTEIAKTLHGPENVRSKPNKIYVSRALSAMRRPFYRVMQNERDIEKYAADRGYEVVCPEIHTFSEQAGLFAEAETVVGPSGSGMFNIAFASDIRRIVDIETTMMTVRQHAKFYSSCSAAFAFLFLLPLEHESQPVHLRPSMCGIADFNRALDWLESVP